MTKNPESGGNHNSPRRNSKHDRANHISRRVYPAVGDSMREVLDWARSGDPKAQDLAQIFTSTRRKYLLTEEEKQRRLKKNAEMAQWSTREKET
jgi:hypothetical protein